MHKSDHKFFLKGHSLQTHAHTRFLFFYTRINVYVSFSLFTRTLIELHEEVDELKKKSFTFERNKATIIAENIK